MPVVQVASFKKDRLFFFSPSMDRKMLVLARGKEMNDLVLIRDVR